MINFVFFDLPDLHMFLTTLPKRMVFPYMAAKKVSIAYSNNFLALFEPPGSFLSWIPVIQNSRSALELAILDPFQGMGHFFHSIFVKELDFQCKISKDLIIPGNFQKFSGTLEITWKWPFLSQFLNMGH